MPLGKIYLYYLLLNNFSDSPNKLVTILHAGKDLAVSFLYFYKNYPEGYQFLSILTSLFAPLSIKEDGCYPLPFYACPDFPLIINKLLVLPY